jgi:hypothetical protein
MSRTISASVITELAKDNFRLCHLVHFALSSDIYVTDFGHDITYGGNTYLASDSLLGVASPQETQELRVGQVNVTVSGAEQSFISIFLNQNWINREATISRAVIAANGTVIGAPIVVFNGQITQFQIDEGNNSSDVTIALASHWADFDKKSGRFTNNNSQQYFFSGDLGFEYSANTVKDLKWGRS